MGLTKIPTGDAQRTELKKSGSDKLAALNENKTTKAAQTVEAAMCYSVVLLRGR